jgi:hypothetical protein
VRKSLLRVVQSRSVENAMVMKNAVLVPATAIRSRAHQ